MAGRLSHSEYLAEARKAVRYVQAAMTSGADNKVGDRVRTFFDEKDSHARVVELRAENRRIMSDIGFQTAADRVDLRAYAAREYGAGNCGEQSALAYTYLRDRGIRPIDWCHFTDWNKDHAFVILDAKAPIRPDNFAQWSDGAVLCDPWGGRAELAGYLVVRWNTWHVESMLHSGLDGEGDTFGGMGGLDARYRPGG